MSLRRRVGRYTAVATAGTCLLTLLIAAVLLRGHLAALQAATLRRQAQVVAAAVRGALPAGAHVFRVGLGVPLPLGRVESERVLLLVRRSGTAQGRITLARHSFLYARASAGGLQIILIRRETLFAGEWWPFLLSLLLAGGAGLLVAAGSAWLLARRLTRPITALAGATQRLAAGEPGIAVVVSGDDELATLGHAFNDMARRLESSRLEQRRFLESVSHELKTPLTSIRGYAEGLLDGALVSEQAGRVIGVEASRLERLVGDLLELARLQRAEFSVECHHVDLGELGRRALERHEPQAQALGITLSHHAQAPEAALAKTGRAPVAATALADPDRLLQAVSNLVENALRLTPAGGAVEIHTAPGRIAVRDTGPGLQEEELPRAFERFYLYERHRSARKVGSGLGLAIVRDLVALMGGTVSVQNAGDGRGGAIFTISLPAG